MDNPKVNKKKLLVYKAEHVLKIQLKIPKVTGNEEINWVVWEWFTNARSKTFTCPVQWSKVWQ
jgi:hypothetical protein